MKYFTRYLLAAVVLVAIIVSGCLTSSAAQKVIYISDNGNGNGSSASSPLGPESVERVPNNSDKTLLEDDDPTNDYAYYAGKKLYENSVLYQAAQKLASTGGKIVLVGDVVIDYSKTNAGARTYLRDFYMPDHGTKEITITSENGGRLIITEGSYISLGGETVFENITFVSKTGRNEGNQTDRNLAICCNGYKTVFGDGINCIYENANGEAVTPPDSSYYLSIAGAARYASTANYDTSVTVKSGKWYCIYGGMYGNAGDIHKGDTLVNISGGEILGNVYGGARPNAITYIGNVNLNISGGTFSSPIYVTTSGGVGYSNLEAFVNISGGTFLNSKWLGKNNGTLKENAYLPYITVDMSEYPLTELGSVAGDLIIYPTAMLKKVSCVDQPSKDICFVGEEYDATGMKIKAEYTNGKSALIEYDKSGSGFEFVCDNENVGKTYVHCTYGGKVVEGFGKNISVIESPSPKIIGAQISTKDKNAGLRFVAEMKKSDGQNITVKDYGFYAWDKARVSVDTSDPEKILGIDEITAFGTHFRPELDRLEIYNNDKKTTFACVYDDIQLCDYSRGIVAVAYVKYEYQGKIYTCYSEPLMRSVLGVANLAVDYSFENVAWIKANIIGKYEEYQKDIADKTLGVYDEENAERNRDIVIDELKKLMNYSWSPSSNIDLTEKITVDNANYYGKYTYTPDKTYYGMVYINSAKAEFEQFEKYIKTFKDGKNVYFGPTSCAADFYKSGDEYNYIQQNKHKIDEKYYELESFFPGCDYTGMVANLWNKVGSNSVWPTGIATFIPSYGRGVLAVGEYDYNESRSYTDTITDASGKSAMEKAYSQCKRGDVVFANTTNGGSSMYMVVEDAKAGSNELKLVMFSPTLYGVKDNSGNVVGYTHFYQNVVSFTSLYNGGYIPVTIPELASGVSAKTTAVVTGFDGDEAMRLGEIKGKIESNKQILSVNVKLSRFDENGEFYDETVYCNSVNDQNTNVFDLSVFNFKKYLVNLVEGKEYTLTVKADIGNGGEKTLVTYKYTKPLNTLVGKYASYKDDFNIEFGNLRQSVIDYMKEQMNVYWTPAETFKYSNLTGASGFVPKTVFKKDTVYMGITYSNMRATLGEFKKVLDKTPVWNSSLGANVYTLSGVSGTTDWNWVMGNHCSASMYHAYQHVIRMHANSRGNVDMELVGLEKDLYSGVTSYTGTIISLYGKEAMYEAYAEALKGDFVYKKASGGHTRIVQEVNVVRNETTGRIDPKKSTILMLEQTDTLESTVYGNSSHGTTDWTPQTGYDSTWWEHKYSFELLASGDSAAIILRPTEFETGETEKHYVGITKKASKTTLERGKSDELGVVESNYPILSVIATIETKDKVYKATSRALTQKNQFNVYELFTDDKAAYDKAPDKMIYIPDFKGQKYSYKLEVVLAAGTVVIDSFDLQ